MTVDFGWAESFARDVRFGYITNSVASPRQHHPQVILNAKGASVLRTLREELQRCRSFTFSVAFVSSRAIALLKQELVEFEGHGRIITSDYLSFNSPEAFSELLNLRQHGIDVRVHKANAFHPKGYIFEGDDSLTVLVGSANLTHNALVKNHEWNLKVSAASESGLAQQVRELVDSEVAHSEVLTNEWVDAYARRYQAPPRQPMPSPGQTSWVQILPNRMQRDALKSLQEVRNDGQEKAIVISATGTGKTMLSALDVRAVAPRRLLFVVHREQILDRTIREYRRVLDGAASDFGKLSGGVRETGSKYLFATIQTLSKPKILAQFAPDTFDYIIIDEAHRAGAPSYQRLLRHFDPDFLLGMTATPERMDGFNVFELFDHNVPYEIRLNHVLEEDMLSPFHYYGISDVEFDDGSFVDDWTNLNRLISSARIEHLLNAMETYGQAGVAPRGLIFCSRKQEARELSEALNHSRLRGRPLRTAALTGEDTVELRLATVDRLEAGELDYILTVDVFNEGVDIPSVNQVIMLRQTQSAIVFVQQLGRGLRKAEGKEYLVVIDFIGNYQNNFMIPIALFGDDSLNKESLRKNMIAAEEAGVLPGLSSVRFDRIAQERVLASISSTKLDSLKRLKVAVEAMSRRVGGIPELWDFWRFESVDPILIATNKEHYPALIQSFLREEHGLSERESRALQLLSHEVLPAKRLHEFVVTEALLSAGSVDTPTARHLLSERGIEATEREIGSAMDTLTLEGFAEADLRRYRTGIASRAPQDRDRIVLDPEVAHSLTRNQTFSKAVDDILRTGTAVVESRYGGASQFVPGLQYSRREACRILNWPRNWTSTIYGYKVDRTTASCPIFVTLHKGDDITASTAYEDELLSRSTMHWFTRSRRTLQSAEVQAIVDNDVDLHVFVKKDDAEGSDFYYLGQATSHEARQTTMPDDRGQALDVVTMLLHFDEPIDVALYDYFHPTVTV